MHIQSLLPQQRTLFENHLKRLDWNDRMMRFESSVNDAYIEKYVGQIAPTDTIFGALDQTGTLVAAAHVSLHEGLAELGLSVEHGHRRNGLGSRLLSEAVKWAFGNGAVKLSSQCLSHNRWMTSRMRGLGFTMEVQQDTTIATLSVDEADQCFSSFSAELRDADLLKTPYGAKLWFCGNPARAA